MDVVSKLFNIYQHLESWAVAAFAFICTWLGDSKELMLYVFVAVIIDTIFGILRSKKNGVSIKSQGIRDMIGKLVVYFVMMICTIMMDKVGCFDSIIITRVGTGIIIGAEVISIFGSLGVMYPKIAAISIVRKFLASEMADKLNTDKEAIEKIINVSSEQENKEN